MPTSTAGNRQRRGYHRLPDERGFTLVEVLVVMLVIAIAATLVGPALGRFLLPRLTPTAADQLTIAIAKSRDDAILKHQLFRGFLQPNSEDAWVDAEGNSLLRLPSSIRIRPTHTESDQPMPCVFRIDGSGCNLTARVVDENQAWLLRVDPVTGRVTLVRASEASIARPLE